MSTIEHLHFSSLNYDFVYVPVWGRKQSAEIKMCFITRYIQQNDTALELHFWGSLLERAESIVFNLYSWEPRSHSIFSAIKFIPRIIHISNQPVDSISCTNFWSYAMVMWWDDISWLQPDEKIKGISIFSAILSKPWSSMLIIMDCSVHSLFGFYIYHLISCKKASLYIDLSVLTDASVCR